MSIDITSIIEEVCFLIAGIAFFFLIPRAVIIGRGFVSRMYRHRAFWFAGVMSVALVAVLSGLISVLFNLYPSTSLSALSILVFLAWILAIFVYADRTILVTQDMDFHHRNTLHWKPVRTLAYVAVFANVFYLYPFILLTEAPTCSSALCPVVYLPGVPSWVPTVFPPILLPEAFLAVLVTLGYTFSAVIIGARRTSDMTMKRHVRWLGLSFLIFLGSFLGFLVGSTWSVLLDSFIFLVMVYPFHRALISLTYIGKLDVP